MPPTPPPFPPPSFFYYLSYLDSNPLPIYSFAFGCSYYAPIIFSNLGISFLTTTAVIGVINFLATFIAIYALDRAGRKTLLLLGAIGMFVSMLVAASILAALDQQLSSALGYVVATFVCLYTASFAATWGPGG